MTPRWVSKDLKKLRKLEEIKHLTRRILFNNMDCPSGGETFGKTFYVKFLRGGVPKGGDVPI